MKKLQIFDFSLTFCVNTPSVWKNIDMEETKCAVLSREHRLKMCVQEKGDRFVHKL